MTIDSNFALNAYNKTSEMITKASSGEETSGSAGSVGDSGGVTFSDFLKAKTEQSVDALRASEEMSAKAVTGEADIVDVVQAVGNAEVTLQTVVALRDRMVSAYQEIMRMPI